MDNEFCRLLSEKLSPEERIFKFKSAELNGHNLDVVFPASLRIEIERTGCNELVSLPSRPWPHAIQSR